MRALIGILLAMGCAAQVFAAPTTQPVGKFAHIEVDVPHREVRVECEAVKASYPLEFLAVVTNTNEYEALVHTDAKPSQVHLGLLMIGLKPGEPLHYVEESKTWIPPTGPAVQIWFEYEKDGKHERVPASRWMRDIKTGKEPSEYSWVFTGSKTLSDGTYGGDVTGYIVSVINNEMSVVDVPALKSRAMESREWERNGDVMPGTGTKVTMILSAADQDAGGATTRP